MLSELGNFTPISHILTREVGLVCAAVYGAVWRYCQMSEGICRASLNTIGADLGIDRATVMRSIDKLCKLGYLVDQTPTRRNAPHTYILGKSVAECNSLESETVAESNSQPQTVAHDNATVAECNATVAESYLKRVLEDTSLRDNKRERETRAPETHLQKLERIGVVDYLAQNKLLAVKLSEICGNPGPEYVVNGKRRELAQATAQLSDWGATVEQLQEFRERWKFDDDPWVSQVVSQWGRFVSNLKKGNRNGQHQGNTGQYQNGKGEGLSEASRGLAAALRAKSRAGSGAG